MAPRARRAAKPSTASQAADAEGLLEHVLGQRDPYAPKIVVMPEGMKEASRFIHLPRACNTNQTGLYLVCPDQGFFECTEVGKKPHHSWILTPPELEEDADYQEPLEAQISQQPQFVVASRLDPLLVVLPLMVAANQACPGVYGTLEDFLYDHVNDQWEPLRDLLRDSSFSHLTERLAAAMKVVSDTLDLGCGEDATYRLSLPKLFGCMLNKAILTAETSFPASWEDTFITQPLEVPTHDIIVSDEIKKEPDIKTEEGSQPESSTASQSTANSQTTTESTSTAASSLTSQAAALAPSDYVKTLLRIRTVLTFMLRSHVPSALHDGLHDLLMAEKDVVDFEPLVEYTLQVLRKKSEMQALRTMSDNISRKRKLDDDEEADKAAERKRKRDEDEARKKSTSQGVKKLMKADVSGMKKLSSFFAKKPST